MKTYLEKLCHMAKSPALTAIYRWSKGIRARMLGICALNVVSVLLSLEITLVTKQLIDGAVASQSGILWRQAVILGVLILAEWGSGLVLSLLRLNASTRLQRSLQGMLMSTLLEKDYAGSLSCQCCSCNGSQQVWP